LDQKHGGPKSSLKTNSGVSVADVLDLAREIEHSSMSVSWASHHGDNGLQCSLLLRVNKP
jgi:hypothetical protein